MRARARLCVAVSLAVTLAGSTHGQPRSIREEAYRQANLGVAHLERSAYDAAAAAFRQALKLDPSLTIARLNLAIAELYDGNLDSAAANARAAVAGIPQSAHAHFVAGLVSRAANRPDEAVRAFQRVLEIDPDDVGSRIHLGQINSSERRYAEAAAYFEAALSREPFNATAAYGLATSLVRGGQRDAGEAAMARFQALDDNPAAITYSANYLEQGRYGQALASSGLEPELVDPTTPRNRFTDATSDVFGERDPRGPATLFDIDRDGDLDTLLAGPAGLVLQINQGGRFRAGGIISVPATRISGAVAADYDNDGQPDLLTIGPAAELRRQHAPVMFSQIAIPNASAGSDAIPRAAAFVDIDHDGDLDVFLSAPNRVLRNDGNGSFSDVTQQTGLSGSEPLVAVVPTDFDNGRDIDLLLVLRAGAPALFANRRDGTFRNIASEAGLPPTANYTAAATADLNKDGAPDFVFGVSDGPAIVAASTGNGRFSLTPAPQGSTSATALQLVDYDNDGLHDLLALTPGGPRLWRHLGSSWSDVTAASLPATLVASDDPPVAMAIGDVDQDGAYDVIARLASGRVRFWRNSRPGDRRHLTVRVRLDARVSNRSGIGARIELRAGSLRHAFESSAAIPPAAPADIVFGAGQRSRADAVRVLWPSGILQAEVDPAARMTVVELDRKPSSCPFLFTWNGTRFDFATDFMGGSEMGAWIAPEVRNVPDTDEYVRLRADQLVAADGRYELRITNELEEALFLDRVQLFAVAHAAGVDIYPNEGLRSPAARRPLTIYTTQQPRPPESAFDHHGHDVLDRLRSIDRRYVDDFRLDRIQGYAEQHSVTLDLGVIQGPSPLRLLLTGWTDYAFSSDNVAAHQAGLASNPPSLEMQSEDGTWKTIVPELGIPVGRPQTVAVDLTQHVPARARRVQLRVVTSLRVYWDQILVDTSTLSPYSIVEMEAVEARLRWRGFSAEMPPQGIGPLTYDYGRVSPVSPWKTMPGRYTRAGDVMPLIAAVDDRFVVAAAGDEIALAFDASALPPLPAGWTRTFLFYADGFSKEMNFHSSSPNRLEPFPFHGMSAYPYRAPERYPQTPAHDRYRAEYNTRVIRGPLPPLDSRFAAEGR